MAKYHEIMEHIEMTEKMQNRILKNVDEHFKKKTRAKRRTVLSLIGTIAAAAAVFGFVFFNQHTLESQPEPKSEMIDQSVAGTYAVQEYDSAKELSEAAGFDVPEAKTIPFETKETAYRLLEENFAEIEYIGKKDTLTFRKSLGHEDNSGDFTEYQTESKTEIQGKTITVKGEKERYYLATWQDGKYSCSLSSQKGMDEKELIAVVSDIIR